MSEVPLALLIVAFFVLLLLSGFFSGSETALMAINRYRLSHSAKAGNRGARLALALLKRPDQLITLILLFNNIVQALIPMTLLIIAERLTGDPEIAVIVATAATALLIFLFAESMPKTLGALHPERLGLPAAYLYWPLLRLLLPVVKAVNLIGNSLLRLLGVTPEQAALHSVSTEELRTIVAEAGHMIPKRHRLMLLSLLDFEHSTVEDIMIPRNEIVGLDLEDDWERIVDQLTHSAYTRLPVYRGSIDQVQGVLHMRKIMPLIVENRLTREALEASMLDPYFVPAGASLSQTLLNFQRERRRVGLVVDEYGEILGMATLEDLLEEIVGEFTTDPSTFARDIQAQPDGSYLVDGGTHVRDLNRALGWHFSTNGPRTLNGLIIESMEMIPSSGTSLLIDGYPVEVVQTQNNAVKTARLGARLKDYKPKDEPALD